MFKIPPNQVKVIFIVHKDYEETFLSFLFNETQYSWIERDFDGVSSKLESKGILLLRNDDVRLDKVFTKFYEVPGITYYFVGSKYLLTTTTVDPFIHNLFVNKTQFKEFVHTFKNMYGISFNEYIKD